MDVEDIHRKIRRQKIRFYQLGDEGMGFTIPQNKAVFFLFLG